MNVNEDVLSPVEAQPAHLRSTFASNPRMYGDKGSEPGRYAVDTFVSWRSILSGARRSLP